MLRFALTLLVAFTPSIVWAGSRKPGYGPGSGTSPALGAMLGNCRDPKTGRTFDCPVVDDPSDPLEKTSGGACLKSRSRTVVPCPNDQAWHREQDARIARERAEDKTRLDAALAKKDPDDVVAQVLNYTSTGIDQGPNSDFWYRPDPSKPCVYQRMTAGASFMSLLTISVDRLANNGAIDLNAIDPLALQVGEMEVGKLPVTMVAYDATPILISNRQLNHDRLVRGWALIYKDGHCEGLKRPF